MLDIFFGGWRKASKCKKLIQMLRCRLKVMKSKIYCIVKHSRDDVSQLLKHGHRPIAFERVEQIILDETTIQSYDLLDQYCQLIMLHLRYIRRHRDCPDDIKEAVSTLIFSSQIFGELPELIPIRNLFGDRYGHRFLINALELRTGNLVNSQIIDNHYIKTVSEELKYGLLAEITTTSIKQAHLFLDYKQQIPEDVDSSSLSSDEMRKEKFVRDAGTHYLSLHHEKESCSDIIRIEEGFVSPMSKDGSLQDLRLFVFKSFEMIPLNNEAYYQKEIGLNEDQQDALVSNEIVPYEESDSEYSSCCRHIHPKLPDYEELEAKFKALKTANLGI